MVTDRQANQRVLVADDDDLVRLVIRRVLERAGLDVTDADSVDAAIEACTECAFALAILDAHMPGGDLATTIEGMRRARPEIPILIISGDDVPPAQAALPRTAFLSKPIDLAALTTQIGLMIGTAS